MLKMHTALEQVCEVLGGEGFPKCESASLRLEKFVRLGDNSKKDEIKKDEINAVVSKPQKEIPKFLPKGGVSFVATLGGRLIVNQAGGVLENAGLCLHPHFGYPYIPGSAVKGCARHAAWQEWDEAEEGETKAAAAKEVAEIFGYPTGDKDLDEYLKAHCGYEKAQAGKVAFLAAVPEKTARLVADVVTPHGGNDWTNPVPSAFLAVEEGCKFIFTISPIFSGQRLADRARHFLIHGLVKNGIGAKTNAGYGHFVSSDESVNSDLRVKLHFDSPAFLRGVRDEGKLRISTLRGMLRWWWRWIYRSILKESDLRDLEKRVWGVCSGQSPTASCVSLRFGAKPDRMNIYPFDKEAKSKPYERLPHGRMSGLAYLSYGMDENGQRRLILDTRPNDVWELLVDVKPREDAIDAEKLIKHVKLAVWALTSFGGVGARSRKGFGSLSSDVVYADENAVYADIFGAIQGLEYEQMLDDDYVADYSMFGSVRGTVSLKETDVWKVLDRIGYALQNVAVDYKHSEDKAVLGLPRQIHGPRKEPMRHQVGHRHQPPVRLRADSRDVEGRLASPLAVHIAKVQNGIRVSLTAFPSNMARDYVTSQAILQKAISEITLVLSKSCQVVSTDGACASDPE